MGNCTGTRTKGKNIDTIANKENNNTQLPPPSPLNKKYTLEEAKRKRELLQTNLKEGDLQPPFFSVPKMEPLSQKLQWKMY